MRRVAVIIALSAVTLACNSDPIDPEVPYHVVVLADNPSVYWRFEETSGNVVNDASVNGRLAALVGTPTQAQSLSNGTGMAYRFDDTLDGVVSSSNTWSNFTAVTVEAWVRPSEITRPEGMIVVDKGSTWNLFITPAGYPAFQFPGSVPPDVMGNTVLQAGETYHLVGTFGDAVMRLYVNGALVDEATLPGRFIDNRDTPVHVARGLTDAAFDFYGLVDDVSIYDRVLSAERITAHYEAGR